MYLKIMKVTINNKEYTVKEAHTEQEKQKGLQGVKELPKDGGMLFYFNPPEIVEFWMKDTEIPLDIIFINDDQEVIKVAKGEPNDETMISSEEEIAYVLEVNQDSGIKRGDILDFEENGPVMKVLDQDGNSQMELWGGERIFSRRNTRVLINKAKKADLSKEDKDYKALGRFMFKCIKGQDTRPNEYVTVPDNQDKN